MKKIVALSLLVFVLVACSPSREKPVDAWLKISPVQCGQNPWQTYWLESNKDTLPEEQSPNNALADRSEGDMVQQYYATQGINIKLLRFRKTMAVTCAACECPRGDILFVSVKITDVKKMKQWGFTEVTPDEKRIMLIPEERYCFDNADCEWIISNCCKEGRASWSCYTKGTAFDCPPGQECTEKKLPSRSCQCLENICEAK